VLWLGIVIGAAITGILGGPIASRLSAHLETRGDRGAGARPDRSGQIDRLASDEALFTAYQRQFISWAVIVGGLGVAVAVCGFLIASALARSSDTAAGVVAAVTAVVVGAIAMFWARKLVAKRGIVRSVYRRRSTRVT
jgi:hypothetical protein